MINKKGLVVLVFLFVSILIVTPPASAQIIENDNNYYYQQSNNYDNSQFWQKEYESYFYPGLGHKEYEVLYQNGYRTNTTRYTGLYVLLSNESAVNQYSVTTTIEYKSGYDSYFTPNKGHKQYIEKWVNGIKTTDSVVYTGNYIILSNETINSDYKEIYNGSFDLYLNTTNDPSTKGLSGCDVYYLNTGNRSVRVHISVPYGYSLIIGGANVEGIDGNYIYFNQGEYNKIIENGFAVIVPNNYLYSEFNARVNQARSNGWDCNNITWPSQY